MAVFSRPGNRAFIVSESKSDEFFRTDAKTGLKRSMEKFNKRGGIKKVKIVR